MENQSKFDPIAYKKAQKRVKEITNYYWFLIGYAVVAVVLMYRDYDKNIFHFKTEYIIFMLVLQGIFLVVYGIYLFVPALHNWEEKKIKKLMNDYEKDGK